MNKKELIELIKTREGYTLEFKENFSNAIGKEICAFANASGGKIILGVKDNNSIIGFTPSNNITSKIQDIARNMEPSFNLTFEMIDNIGIIYVPEGKDKPYSVGGKFYLRLGANSQRLNREKLLEFFQNCNKISFEHKINSNFSLKKDFDKSKFKTFIKKAGISKTLPINHVLKNLNLLTNEKPNNACVLLFPYRVTKFFLSADISCVLYSGDSNLSLLDKKVFDADFISNFENALSFILRNIKTKAEIIGVTRVETPEIPEKALRETILNAMIHRNYFIEGRILINIFANKVEISNPGKLLFNRKELGNISVTRNPIIADCMLRSGFVEKIGSGIKRIKELVPNVKFEISSDWFRVVFVRNKLNIKVDTNRTQIGHKSDTNPQKRQKWIIIYLKKNYKINSKTIINTFNVVKDTVARDLKALIKENKIIKKGAGNNVWYELK